MPCEGRGSYAMNTPERDRDPGIGQQPVSGWSDASATPFDLAMTGRERRHLTLVHKTNVLTFAGDLWERTFNEVAARSIPEVETAYNHVDAACIYMVVQSPEQLTTSICDRQPVR